MTHRLPVHVYYEDTDLAGIVYYANYLKFIERGRTEYVRHLGIDQVVLKERGVVFAVRHLEADYLKPAHFDDDLVVETDIAEATGVRIVMAQSVTRDGETLFRAKVTLVALGPEGRAVRLPEALRAVLD